MGNPPYLPCSLMNDEHIKYILYFVLYRDKQTKTHRKLISPKNLIRRDIKETHSPNTCSNHKSVPRIAVLALF